MCEKRSEFELRELLHSSNFNKSNLYYSIFENHILKKIFAKCSKNGNSYGIPDCVYFDNNTLIIFECKKDNLHMATQDIKKYCRQLLNSNHYNIYWVEFVNTNIYKIYKFINKELEELKDKILNLSTFNINSIKHNTSL
jgi:hypothetical protein